MTSRRQPSEPAVMAAIEAGCRTLRLPTIRDRFSEIAAAAEREQLTYLGFLAELVMAECDDRTNRRALRRVHAAGFPRPKRLEEFDFAANPAINPATIAPARRRGLDPGRAAAVSGRGLRHREDASADRAGHRRRRTRLPGQVHDGVDDWSTSSPKPPTNANSPAWSTATDASICSCSTNSATSNSTAAGRNCCSKSSPSVKRRTASRSPPTNRSPAGRRRSPTPDSAPPSSTASPSTATSSKPAPPATASPTPGHGVSLPRPPRRDSESRTPSFPRTPPQDQHRTHRPV